MADPEGSVSSRPAAFMQYAYCMHDEGVWHDACKNRDDPHVMGYAIRTRRWRYVEWVKFDRATASPVWTERLGSELYDHTEHDTVKNVAESVNVVLVPENQGVVDELRKQLHAGWRGAALV